MIQIERLGKIKTRKNNPCHRPSCQRPTSGLEVRPHANTRIPENDHNPHLNNLGWYVQKVPFALYALEPHYDAQQQTPFPGGPADDTSSAETHAITGGRSGGGAGTVDW